MKKVKKTRPGCLYLFKSLACSNTVYYEQLDDAKQFLVLANQYLKDYLFIHEYMLCKEGWVFVCRLKSEKNIQKAYAKKRKRRGKAPKSQAAWLIISEQMRLFIAKYVTQYNHSTGREGVLVKRSYERYYFETNKSAKRMMQGIRRRLVGLQQGKKMYRAKKGHYRIPKNLGKGAIYLSSRRKRGKGDKVRNSLELAVFQRISRKVLTKKMKKLIQLTQNTHKTPIPDI